MSSLQPSPSNAYLIPPDWALSRANLQALVSSIHERLAAREALEATFESLVAQGVQQSQALIQQNIAPSLLAARDQIDALDSEIATARASIAQLLGGNLPAAQVVESAARRFVPAAPDASRRMLLGSTSSLAFEVAVSVDAQGGVTIPELRVPWSRVTGAPATFPPAAHAHAIEQVAGLETRLNSLANGVAAREPALPAPPTTPTQRYLRGDRTWAPSSDLQRAIATTAQAQAGTDNATTLTPFRMREALRASGEAPVFAARAWVNFDGTTTPPTIRASGNVASVTRLSANALRVTFATLMPDANYAVVCSGGVGGNLYATSRAVGFVDLAVNTTNYELTGGVWFNSENGSTISNLSLTSFPVLLNDLHVAIFR